MTFSLSRVSNKIPVHLIAHFAEHLFAREVVTALNNTHVKRITQLQKSIQIHRYQRIHADKALKKTPYESRIFKKAYENCVQEQMEHHPERYQLALYNGETSV